ncbi:hypothetical protein [Rhodopila sp.]|jgi:hypothetical protein|uniref:hypothetical protein n=1 Tax=Rhodopila sp. TaxID=2480087 RepID=UPI002B74C485|nr:hypothetical protein [Rhodopila sp.]HVZ08434.1 hypothetical protein [Rhodopila sp.]
MRTTLFRTPDGFATGRHGDTVARRYEGAAEGVASLGIEAVPGHERDDDGLVHGHRWADTEMQAGPPRPAPHTRAPAEERCDDGLVHGHHWASAAASQAPHARPTAWSLPLVMLLRQAEQYDDGLVHDHAWAAGT